MGPATRLVQARIKSSLTIHEQLLERRCVRAVTGIASLIADALRNGNKLIVFGNGGSAADAQHLAAELVGRFLMDRSAMPAICLCDNPSIVTSIGNDYGFERVFARQIEGLGDPGDVALGISTSGESKNVIEAIEAARARGLVTVALTGAGGDELRAAADYSLAIPSDETPRIQEGHGLVAHLLCELIELELTPPDA